MDMQLLIQGLNQTLDPNLRVQAEAFLDEVNRLPDFTPCLLQILVNESVSGPTRQAAAIYLKNCVYKYWKEREASDPPVVDGQPAYSIPEQAKAVVRDNVVGAIIQTPLLIQRQLCVCLEQILKHDFPERWTGVVTSVHAYLASDSQPTWLGSLLSLYQLSKKYKFKKAEERMDYITAMKTILPLLYQRMVEVLPDPGITAVTLQHHILKIFYATMQYTLPLDLIDDNTLPGWMIVLQTIVQRPVPPDVQSGVDEDELPQLEWWKCKKWALHILCRLFDRYGNPANVEKVYSVFAHYYMKTFNAGVLGVLLRQLDVKRQGNYVSPRVVQGIFNYLIEAVDQAVSWRLIKPHFELLFQDVVFKMMCYSEEDDALWNEDPYEYIRMKFDIFEDLVSPLVAAQHFLTRACAKRKNTLDPVMAFCVQVLNTPVEQRDPRTKDGALHVIGSVSEVLMKKHRYRAQLESMLVAHVYPEFQSPHGYMRARACWMIHYFSEITFTDQNNLSYGLQQVFQCLIHESELPVKVEAAVAMQYLIKHQTIAENFIQPYVKDIIQELLTVIRETENDDLTSVMQELIETYADQIGDVAIGLCASLVETFNEIVDPSGHSADEDSYKALTALGILSAIQALVKATFNEGQIMQQMEATLMNMMATILQNGVMDFYEEMLALLDLFTSLTISPAMWQMLFIMYDTFTRDGFDFFTEMMSVLYNFVKVDTEAFLSNPKHLEVIVAMCKSVLEGDPGEDPQVHACKLLEVIVLQCQRRIDVYLPTIAEVAMSRLTRESRTPDLRTMCLQVLVSILYCNSTMMLQILEKTRFPDCQDPVTMQFLSQWIKDAELFMGVHDRKISVLGFCTLLQSKLRPLPVTSLAPKFIPAIITQLEGLVESYKQMATEDCEEDDDEDGEGEEEDAKELDSEEDDLDESQDYLKHLAKKAAGALQDGDGDSDSSEGLPQTMLEIDFETVVDDEDIIDEFHTFKSTLELLSREDLEWYGLLTSGLTPQHYEALKQLFLAADQRKAARASRQIELAGGYQFSVTEVPNTFVFSP